MMTEVTNWTKLPEDVLSYLFDYYCGVEGDIYVDCLTAGINVTETDYNDDDWARYFTFASGVDLSRFLDIASFEDHPSGCDWEIEDHDEENSRLSASDRQVSDWEYLEPGQFTLWIPRLDLHIVAKNLKRINEITVDDYETKWNDVRDAQFTPLPRL